MSIKIEWTDESWNPITGCTKISPGCKNCYAEKMAKRLAGRFGYPADDPFKVKIHPDKLAEPLKWKKPRRIFVCSMGDLFHKDVEKWMLDRIFDRIFYDGISHHKFLILTKRPKNMYDYFDNLGLDIPENVWLGVSVENQQVADERIPILLQIPAAVRFLSVEPYLSEIDFKNYLHCGISLCIFGCESGYKARPMNEDWIRKGVTQCKKNNVKVFYKQKMEAGKLVSLPLLDGIRYAELPETHFQKEK